MKVTFEPIDQPDLLSDYIEAVTRYVRIQPPRAYFEANQPPGSPSHKNISVRYVPVNSLLWQYRRLGVIPGSRTVS